MGEKEVMVIIIKEFIIGIRALELNLFELVTRVSYYRVYRQECYGHHKMCDIMYLMRAFIKSQYKLYKAFAYSAYLSSWVILDISKYKLT